MLCHFNRNIHFTLLKIPIIEFSTLFILQMNTLQPYIIITTYPYICLYIYNNPPLSCNNICLT